MEDKKVFIKVDPNGNPPEKTDRYLTSYGFMNYSCEKKKWIPANSFGTKRTPSWYMKEISLTELMVGFAEWSSDEYTYDGDRWKPYGARNVLQYYTTKELVDIYLKEKNI